MTGLESGGPRFVVDEERCIRCGECVNDCPVNILVIGDASPAVAPGRERHCIGCQHCLAVCPVGAVSVSGIEPGRCLPLAGERVPSRELERLLRGRRSVRRYEDENVDARLIRDLLETANHAPSARNARRVAFTVVDDRVVMQQIRQRTMELLVAAVAKDDLPQRFAFYRDIVAGWREFRADVIFRWAPHLLLTSAPEDCPAPLQDSVIALSYFDLAAQNSGLGTLWNGMVLLTMQLVPELREMLAIATDHRIGYAMSFGKPAVDYHRGVHHGAPDIRRVPALGGG